MDKANVSHSSVRSLVAFGVSDKRCSDMVPPCVANTIYDSALRSLCCTLSKRRLGRKKKSGDRLDSSADSLKPTKRVSIVWLFRVLNVVSAAVPMF